MLLKGPNRDAEPQSFMADMKYEQQGNEECMREFFTHNFRNLGGNARINDGKPKQYCIILLKSGTLRMHNCILSLDGIFRETYRKVPCITVLEGASLEIYDCKFKGDTTNDASTAGIVSMDADVQIYRSEFQHFKSGGILV